MMSKPSKNKLPRLEWKQSGNNAYITEILDCTYINLTTWNYEKVFNNCWQIHYAASAKASIIFQGKKYKLNTKNVFLIPSNTPFSTILEQPGDFFSITFRPSSALESLTRKVYLLPARYLKETLPSLLLCNHSQVKFLKMQSMVFHYLSIIPSDEFVSKWQDFNPKIAQALEIMENELSAPSSIKTICKRIRISLNKFHSLFLQEVKKTPKKFLADLRLQHSIYLLRHTEKSIEEIAIEVGFSNRYQFSKFFRAATNDSPVAFRTKDKRKMSQR